MKFPSALCFLVLSPVTLAQNVVMDQKTLMEPVRDNSISLVNDGNKDRIIIDVTFVVDVEVLYGFAMRRADSVKEDVLGNAIMKSEVTKNGAFKNVKFAVTYQEILAAFPGAAAISTKSNRQNIFEGGKYPLKLNIPNRICEISDSNGNSMGVLEFVVGERIKGEILMNYLIDGKLAPLKK